MAIEGIEQPEIIQIDENLRLRKFDWVYDFALEWYQDKDTVWLIDGDRDPYTPKLMKKMYSYQDEGSELYFIEVLEDGEYKPIGDVAFEELDMPIMIGEKKYRGQGIGTRVVGALIDRAKELGFKEIQVEEIYEWNIGSQRLFMKLGFVPFRVMPNGHSYRLELRR
ncbi:MAG: GNAT family N-acetyltransferase [Tissierellia bacterium]|nr:GNAT family N-acetyltransferase [Tissierellia bacterium]